MKKKTIYIVTGIILLSLSLIYTFTSVNGEAETHFNKSAKVTKGKVQKKILLVGQISPSQVMVVNSSITGKIIKKEYSLGDSVSANETLLKIKPDPEKYVEYLQKKNAYYRSKMELKETEIDYLNNKTLFELNHIKKDDFDKSKNDYELAKMSFEIDENVFEIYKNKYKIDENNFSKMIPIKASISGIIIEDNVEEGNYVKSALSEYNEGTVICKIGNFDELKADFTIAEEYLPLLHKGDKIKLSNKKKANLGYGEIEKISPIGNSEKGFVSFDFSVKFKSQEQQFYPGSSITAELISAQKDSSIRVPISVINFEDNKPYVLVKENEGEVKRDIKIGVVGNKFVEITDGLSLDENLVY